jgi:adenylate kinase family enzyme
MPGLPANIRRIVVVGVTCSGKTTLARQLAAHLGCPHVDLDALHWEAGWQAAPLTVFRERVAGELDRVAWVVDGNYSKVRDLVWPLADMLVWLDYALPLALWRLVRRTARRIVTREVLWNGNRETVRALLGRDSLLAWLVKSYFKMRRGYPLLLARPEYAHLTVVRLRSPGETRRWLAGLGIDSHAAVSERPMAREERP